MQTKYHRAYKFKGKSPAMNMSTKYLRRLIGEAERLRKELQDEADRYGSLLHEGEESNYHNALVARVVHHDKKFKPYVEELADRMLLESETTT